MRLGEVLGEFLGYIYIRQRAGTQNNLLLLGPSGTGKTTFLATIMKETKCWRQNSRTAFVAARGDAAMQHERGQTIYEYAGMLPKAIICFKELVLSLPKILPSVDTRCFFEIASEGVFIVSDSPWISEADAELAYESLRTKGCLFKPSRSCNGDVLLVDDVFCFSPVAFAVADIVLRGRRNNFAQPFGGLMLIAAGDPLKGVSPRHFSWLDKPGSMYELDMCHLSASAPFSQYFAWFNRYVLRFNFRLKDDKEFAAALGELRLGKMTMAMRNLILARAYAVPPIGAFHLFLYPSGVDRFNAKSLASQAPVSLFYEAVLPDGSPYNLSRNTMVPVKAASVTHLGGTVRLCTNLGAAYRTGMTFKLLRVVQMEKNMAAEVEIQGPLDAEISAQKTLNVLPVVWDDDIMTYDDAYRVRSRGKVRALPLVHVDYAFTASSFHTRQVSGPVVIHLEDDGHESAQYLYASLSRIGHRNSLYVVGADRLPSEPWIELLPPESLRYWLDADALSSRLEPRCDPVALKINVSALELTPMRTAVAGEGRPPQKKNNARIQATIVREKISRCPNAILRYLRSTAVLGDGRYSLQMEKGVYLFLSAKLPQSSITLSACN